MPAEREPAARKRLFIALWPDDPVRQALAAWARGWAWPEGAARVPAERWHLTLHFLGDVDAARLAEMARALAVPVEPCEIAFGAAVVWPRGLAVLEALAVPPALADLHARLATALRQLGLPVEQRRFRPHLTLARRAAGATPPRAPLQLRWPVRGYALVESAGGYRTLLRYD